MTDIEQARELLRKVMTFGQRTHYDAGRPVDVTEAQALSAIADALRAAPEGFRLVLVEPTDAITADWVLGYLDTYAPEQSRDAIRNAFAEYTQLSDAGTQLGGRITGWSMTEGIRVFSVSAHSSILDEQKFVRYDDHLAAISQDRERMDWLESQCVEVRNPMLYGSHHRFSASPEGSELDEDTPSPIRKLIDQHRIATVTPPRDLRTQLPTEADHA